MRSFISVHVNLYHLGTASRCHFSLFIFWPFICKPKCIIISLCEIKLSCCNVAVFAGKYEMNIVHFPYLYEFVFMLERVKIVI